MKDIGTLKWFLGIEFKFEYGCVNMNQTNYAQRIMDRFKINDCKPKSVPCDLSTTNISSMISKELTDVRLYREIIGSLIYIMTGTRPDLCYIVTKLSQFMSKCSVSSNTDPLYP